MNCFQKLLSSWWRTTLEDLVNYFNVLWIAFKNYYLRDEGQQPRNGNVNRECCELLSKIIIFVMKDNRIQRVPILKDVVNCFQKLLSSWWRTTPSSKQGKTKVLWIAFKNYYLRDEGQPYAHTLYVVPSCELLSKIIIFVMKDNSKKMATTISGVVNCFQKLLSSWWRTTKKYL